MRLVRCGSIYQQHPHRSYGPPLPRRGTSGSWPAAYRAVRGIVGSWSFAEISNNPMLLIQAIQQLPTPAGHINLTMSFDGDKPISTTLVEL